MMCPTASPWCTNTSKVGHAPSDRVCTNGTAVLQCFIMNRGNCITQYIKSVHVHWRQSGQKRLYALAILDVKVAGARICNTNVCFAITMGCNVFCLEVDVRHTEAARKSYGVCIASRPHATHPKLCWLSWKENCFAHTLLTCVVGDARTSRLCVCLCVCVCTCAPYFPQPLLIEIDGSPRVATDPLAPGSRVSM